MVGKKMDDKEDEKKNKESIIKLLNIVKKYNIDSNIQIKLDNIERRIKK